MKKEERDGEIIASILTEEELASFKKGYELYKSTKNEEQKKLLLRRIQDVVSSVRYIDLSKSIFSQEKYEILAERIENLRIVIANILNSKPIEERTLKYCADETNTPLLLRSIEYADTMSYEEIAFLIESTIKNTGEEKTLNRELKSIEGGTKRLLFLRKDNKIIIYDIDSIFKPLINKEDYALIREKCLAILEETKDGLLQKTYDEMIYQTIRYNISSPFNGFQIPNRKRKGK